MEQKNANPVKGWRFFVLWEHILLCAPQNHFDFVHLIARQRAEA